MSASKRSNPTNNSMDSQPLVSVVIPLYQIEDYIEDAVVSVINQTFQDWELICVDDGTADDSRAICEAFANEDTRISVVRQEHAGLGAARNTGIAHARGEFIYFLDGDDILLPETLQLCVDAAVANDAEIVQFCARVLAQDGRRHSLDKYVRSKVYPGVWNGVELYLAQRSAGDYIPQACMYMSRLNVFLQDAAMFPEGIIHEDEYATYRALTSAQRVVCLDKQLYVRRYRPNSIMSERDWPVSSRGYFRTYALVYGENVPDESVGKASRLHNARSLHLEAMAITCIDCFYRCRLPVSEFAIVVGAQDADSLALESLLRRRELCPRFFSMRRMAWFARVRFRSLGQHVHTVMKALVGRRVLFKKGVS